MKLLVIIAMTMLSAVGYAVNEETAKGNPNEPILVPKDPARLEASSGVESPEPGCRVCDAANRAPVERRVQVVKAWIQAHPEDAVQGNAILRTLKDNGTQ